MDAVQFWAKVNKDGQVVRSELGQCWEWTGQKTGSGYGRVAYRVNGKKRGKGAHRVAWELMISPVPSGMCVLHSCDNPPCVNPSHLWIGTQIDNIKDMVAKGRGRTGAHKISGDAHWCRQRRHDPSLGQHAVRVDLTLETVREARTMYATGKWTFRALSKRFKVGLSVVRDAVRGRSWAHVPGALETPPRGTHIAERARLRHAIVMDRLRIRATPEDLAWHEDGTGETSLS